MAHHHALQKAIPILVIVGVSIWVQWWGCPHGAPVSTDYLNSWKRGRWTVLRPHDHDLAIPPGLFRILDLASAGGYCVISSWLASRPASRFTLIHLPPPICSSCSLCGAHAPSVCHEWTSALIAWCEVWGTCGFLFPPFCRQKLGVPRMVGSRWTPCLSVVVSKRKGKRVWEVEWGFEWLLAGFELSLRDTWQHFWIVALVMWPLFLIVGHLCFGCYMIW